MTRKIVAIGGGNTYQIDKNGNRLTYETREIDQEIINLTEKEKPNFLFLAHSQLDFGEESEKEYYNSIKMIYRDIFGCECRWLKISDLLNNMNKVYKDVLWADIIYEGRGGTYNMIKFWKKTGFDKILREAWESGKVMCGVSAGAICWFKYGNTLDHRFINNECNKIDGLGFINAYISPHCHLTKKNEMEKRSLKYIDSIGVSLSDCCAIEIIDDEYRIIKSTPHDENFRPYAMKKYWDDGKYYEEKLDFSECYKKLNSLLSKNIGFKG